MTRAGWLADALLVIGALISAYCGAAIMVTLIGTAANAIHHGAGGIGAVSAGPAPPLLIAVLACIFANRFVAGPARQSGGLLRALHRTHSVTLIACAVVLGSLFLGLVVSIVPWAVLIASLLSIGILLALQFLLLAAILAALVRRRHGSVRA